MRKGSKRVLMAAMDEKDRKELYCKTVGALDASAIIGLRKGITPYTVWACKTGRSACCDPSECVDSELLRIAAERFAVESGKRSKRCSSSVFNKSYPFARAEAFRSVVGEDAGLCVYVEHGSCYDEVCGEGIPLRFYVECLHDLAVCGCERWYLGILSLPSEFKWFKIERDETAIALLMSAEKEFCDCVSTSTPPCGELGSQLYRYLMGIDPQAGEGEYADLSQLEAQLLQYSMLSNSIKELEAQRDGFALVIKDAMKGHMKGRSAGFKVSYGIVSRSVFDHRRFSAENPSIDLLPYFNVSRSRGLRVTRL